MTDVSPSSTQTLYQGLAVWLLAVVGAVLLYVLVRIAVSRWPGAKGKGLRIFASRLAVPLVFSLVFFFILETHWIGPNFRPYVIAGLIIFTFFTLIRILDAGILAWYTRGRRSFPLPDVLRRIMLGILYLVILLVVLKNVLSINITPYLATSAILTMVLGLALQGVLSNILSGMALHLSRSFNRGDWIALGGYEGIVVDTNWRETRILNRSKNLVILPNTFVANEKITNFSQPDAVTGLSLHLKISAAAPAQRVLDVLLEAAHDCPSVLTEPSPHAYLENYDTFGLSYRLKFYVREYARKNGITTDVARLVWYKLRRKGIDIAVPLDELAAELAPRTEIKPAGRPGEPPLSAEAETEENLSVLLQSTFLRYQEGEKAGRLMVPEEDARALAAVVKRAVYAKGEVLCRQGDPGRSCYIIARGRIRGQIISEENGKRYSSEFEVGPGGIFGEMSLFTGMPRTATGVVAEEAVLLKIHGQDFGPVLGKNPGLAEVIADLVSARNEQNKDALLKIKELSEKDVHAGTNKRSILEYLKKLVGHRH